MPTFSPPRPDRCPRGFTLLETLVTIVLVLLVFAALFEFTSNVEHLWKTSATDPFVDAQEAFEDMALHLAAATLEPYQDYADTTGAFRVANSTAAFVPDHLARRSDLAFACGPGASLLAGSGRVTAGDGIFFVSPQGYTVTDAHLGLERLLNAVGYFVDFGDNPGAPAFILSTSHRWRWRLREVMQPSEALAIFATTTSAAWVQPLAASSAPASVLADNVIALIVLPEAAVGDAGPPLPFAYDSRDATSPVTRHQLPARLVLALVAIDEASAQALAAQNGTQAPLLIPSNLFTAASQLQADLSALDTALTARGIGHRILQREIVLPAAAWTDAPSS